ncbi:MAG TPA: amino acid permease [Methanoregulaceae archaeon]|nr:amino acid permease [Methanoregulaceae archaeon]
MELKRDLSLFDLTNIVVGSIIGADIYVASALTAGMLGPFSIVIWVIAGIFATILALVFAYCSYYVPKVGGPFAYVSEAFDDFYGFLTGWSMWIAELISLPVFAIAFVRYLEYLIPLNSWEEIMIKGIFLFALTLVNIFGVKLAGMVNDVLTLIKIMPLLLLIGAGIVFIFNEPDIFFSNYHPFIPLGISATGPALVLIFWAYAGFELATLPAAEVKNPKSTIPKAIILGMSIVAVFYISTNFIVYGAVNWADLALSTTPLILVGGVLLGSAGALIMTIGALFSVSGSDESGMLGTGRLSYAMSIDGLFPRVFSTLHPKYCTPYIGLALQAVIAFLLSVYTPITELISFAVFNLAFAFLLTCFSLIILAQDSEKKLIGQNILPWLGILICLYLMYSTSLFEKIIGIGVILIGVILYVFFSPKEDIYHLKEMFLSEEAIFFRTIEKRERFLGNFMRLLHRFYQYIIRTSS